MSSWYNSGTLSIPCAALQNSMAPRLGFERVSELYPKDILWNPVFQRILLTFLIMSSRYNSGTLSNSCAAWQYYMAPRLGYERVWELYPKDILWNPVFKRILLTFLIMSSRYNSITISIPCAARQYSMAPRLGFERVSELNPKDIL